MRERRSEGVRGPGQRWGIAGLMVVALLFGWSSPALANGGTIQVSEQPAGPYRVTVMTSPSPLRTGTADVSVMVTLGNTSAVVQDAIVLVVVTPVGKTGAVARYPATHANATNKLYYAANVPLTHAGRYAFTIQVTGPKGGGDVRFDTDVSEGYLGMTPFELTCTALPIAGFIAFLVFTLWTRRAGGSITEKPSGDAPA